MAKPLAELSETLGIQAQAAWRTLLVNGICEDSRKVAPGDVFVAIPGHDQSGESFIPEAIARGAVAIVSQSPLKLPVPALQASNSRRALANLSAALFDHPTRKLFTVGVTGTNGKTTVCHWIADLMGQSDTCLLTTVTNAQRGLTFLTTPPNPLIQREAWAALRDGKHNLVVEASSAGIAQERLEAVDFDACVFTNLTAEHEAHHGGLDAYRRAKLKLFEALPSTAWAVVNADDPLCQLIEDVTSAKVLTYGITSEAMLGVQQTERQAASGSRSVLRFRDETASLTLKVPGAFQVANALAAIGVGLCRGLSFDALAARMENVPPIAGHTQRFQHADGRVAWVDFAHNPASLSAMAQTLKRARRRLILVFGCPGDGEHAKRAGMAKTAARWADVIILTTDNPKHEDPAKIVDELWVDLAGSPARIMIELDRAQAIRLAAAEADSPEDVILLAGKGHETSQVVGERRMAFSDQAVLRALGFRESLPTT